MAGVWMCFMLLILAIWAAWMNKPSELSHPNSEGRARISLAIVSVIGVVSLVFCFAMSAKRIVPAQPAQTTQQAK